MFFFSSSNNKLNTVIDFFSLLLKRNNLKSVDTVWQALHDFIHTQEFSVVNDIFFESELLFLWWTRTKKVFYLFCCKKNKCNFEETLCRSDKPNYSNCMNHLWCVFSCIPATLHFTYRLKSFPPPCSSSPTFSKTANMPIASWNYADLDRVVNIIRVGLNFAALLVG